MKLKGKNCVYRLFLGFVLSLIFTTLVYAKTNPQYMTGLPELTPEELEYQNKNQLRTKKVKFNQLGLERINQMRKKKGLKELSASELKTVPQGTEIEASIDSTDFPLTESILTPGELPSYIDNSTLKYFPPIRSQGSLPSCGCFNGTYYAMTYMHAFANNIDAKNGGDSTHLSPKWTYNMVNDGEQQGSWYYDAYRIGQKHGCSTWQEFPYDTNYRAWCLVPTVWKNSIYRKFDQYGYVSGTDTDSGITQVKELLTNGYILNIPTYIYSWNYKTIGNDPSTTEDDAFVGKNCAYYVNGTSGYHAMTVVGYNDNIWVDINNNGTVDSGEKGAFRIANSWGTGWGESGFVWMAYDALKGTSAVEGGPNTSRITGWYPARAHWVTAHTAYTPSVLAEFTISHLKRDQLRMSLGSSYTSETSPTTTWYPNEVLYYAGGPYGFAGTTVNTQSTFYLDFTDIASAGGLKRYYLGVYDRTSLDPAVLASFKLIDMLNGGIEIVSSGMPRSADLEQIYAYVDYDFNDGNIPPVAVATSSETTGVAPKTITFDGSQSSDANGTIVDYTWDFGDQTQSRGSIVEHTYGSAGNFEAILTVTDDKGATSQDYISITIDPDPDKVIYVESIAMSLLSTPAGKSAVAQVIIHDLQGGPLQGATVNGLWSGLTSLAVSGVTDETGSVTFTSKKSKSAGTFTFTVSQVSLNGYQYDSSLNLESSDTISTSNPVNETPIAQLNASQTTGEAPLTIIFDGTASYDPDGVITSYRWDFGDGISETGAIVEHTYTANGSYSAVLTVTDNLGAQDSNNVTINIIDPNQIVYVSNIEMQRLAVPGGEVAEATITVRDGSGWLCPGALVTVAWSGGITGTATGTTDENGQVILQSKKTRSSSTIIVTILSVSKAGYLYDSNVNIESKDSI